VRGRAGGHLEGHSGAFERLGVQMRLYTIAAGVVFGLLAIVHVWRMIDEPHLAADPWFVLATLAAAGLSIAAWRLVRRSGRS
jgi:hypothetical protein